VTTVQNRDPRPDVDLLGLDVEAAIARGMSWTGVARAVLFREVAIAASWQAQRLDVGPYPLTFLARYVRAAGIRGALDLPEPLIGAERVELVRGWLSAAITAEPAPADDDLFAQWLDAVAAVLAVRRSAGEPVPRQAS
jgi:hypothetical protein